MFSMDLNSMDLKYFHLKRVWSIVLFENVPQLVIQSIFLWYAEEFEIVAISAMALSLISVIVAVTAMMTKKQILDSSGYASVTFKVMGSALTERGTYNLIRRMRKIREQIASVLGVRYCCSLLSEEQLYLRLSDLCH